MVLLVVAAASFATGLVLGHRMGYDKGWRDCKFDMKETGHPVNDDPFWIWYDSNNSAIRKCRNFFG